MASDADTTALVATIGTDVLDAAHLLDRAKRLAFPIEAGGTR